MKRRTFIAALGATIAWPFAARAYERIPRIGYLPPAPEDADKPMRQAFEAGLSEFGWIPGKTIEIESRFAGGDMAKMTQGARELVDLKVDLIMTAGPGVFAAHQASDKIPVVVAAYGAIDELVALGMVASLAHPGGAVTGETFELDGLFVKRVELLKQVKPAMTSVGLLHLENSPFNPFIPILEAKVKTLGLTPEPIAIADPGDCERALSAAAALVGGLMVSDEPQFTLGSGPAVIAAAALRHGVPTAGPTFFANSGGLLTYAVDFLPMAHRAAYFVDRILKGAKPGDIPIEQATKFVTVVNLNTAKALGLEIPPTLLAQADEVIE